MKKNQKSAEPCNAISNVAEQRVLVFTPTGRDSSLVCSLLEEANISAYACDDMQVVCQEIENGVGVILISEEALFPNSSLECLREMLSKQPAWSDLPLVILTSEEWSKRRGSDLATLTNATHMERPVRAGTLITAVQVALRSRQRQYQVRDYLIEREQNERTLRETQTRLKLAVEASNVGLWDWNVQTNEVYFSPEWKRQLGYEDHEIFNRFEEWENRLHPDDHTRALAAVKNYLQHPSSYFESEVRLRHKDGAYRWIFSRASLVLGTDGKPVRMLGLHLDITARRQMEDQLRQHREKLEELVAQRTTELREIASHLENVREEEKAKIARELHDEIGATLTALKMDTVWLSNKLSDQANQNKIRSMIQLVDSALLTSRRIQSELRPALLDNLGLVAAIQWQATEFKARTGINCSVSMPDSEVAIDGSHAIALFRVLQEALTNVIRHAQASNVNVSLSLKNDKLVLEISDDGKGLSQERLRDGTCHGIRGMVERARYLGGEVEISGQPGKGAKVCVWIPRPEAQSASQNNVEFNQ